MKIRKIFGWIPVPVFKWGFKGTLNGRSFGVVVFVKDLNNKDVILHELKHAEQFYRTLGLHPILYFFSRKYKLFAEIEAYKTSNRTNISIAHVITNYYDLGFSFSYVLEKVMTYKQCNSELFQCARDRYRWLK